MSTPRTAARQDVTKIKPVFIQPVQRCLLHIGQNLPLDIKIKNAFIIYTDIISKNKHYHDNLFNHRKDFYYQFSFKQLYCNSPKSFVLYYHTILHYPIILCFRDLVVTPLAMRLLFGTSTKMQLLYLVCFA